MNATHAGLNSALAARRRRAVRQLLGEKSDTFDRQGYVVETWRQYQGRRLGPYYRLRYREDGRQRSAYLGKSKRLAKQVRRRLQRLQAPMRQRREDRRFWAGLHAWRRKLKAHVDGELARIGLRPHGYEVRGWRQVERRALQQRDELEKRESGAPNGPGLTRGTAPITELPSPTPSEARSDPLG